MGYAYFRMYGYNSTSGHCEQFIYGGCGGNDNRFESLEECKDKCEHRRKRCIIM
ncbi:unnamed protein product [Dibothriocephalus latus]|uniref:BPTI/Kunitz inhibitor domain-containing protein n=1 Tax=Dibothriocephalus latus TaxID=60516 RepID=A0A3P7LT17_DIBLA|nr:unnamed protein product [Dibothriocephalus latus]